MKRILSIWGLVILMVATVVGQNLRRQGMLGIQPQELDPVSAKAIGLEGKQGVLVMQVFPNSTAANIGIQPKDIMLSLNTKATPNNAALFAALQGLRAGDEVEVEAFRDGKVKKLSGKMLGRPLEQAAQGEVRYDEVAFEGGYLRAYISKPDGKGPFPAIYFIQGYPCQTVELLNPIHPYKKMVDGLVGKGYVVFRIEKPGMGDSEGTPNCMEIDFEVELNGFRKGYEHLLQYDFVDNSQISIFGHSLGGLTAPLLAREYKPANVIVYGVVLKNWEDYIVDMIRDQSAVFGQDYAQIEQDILDLKPVMYSLYHEGKSPALLAQNPAYKALLERHLEYQAGDIYINRHYSFWADINRRNITQAWKETESRVLAMYGEADIEALSQEGAESIATVVNHYHPGRGTFKFVSETDHSFIKVGDIATGWEIRQSGQYGAYLQNSFNFELIDYID
ncbi:MAG: PDZ domain-containing protein, partial [Bacteroidota bacterium]